MTSYFVSPEGSKRWRERVLELATEQALSGSARERTVATKLFEEALHLPHGYFGRPVPDEVREAWRSDQEATLDAIERVANETVDSAVRVGLARALDWHSAHGPWDDLSARAARLVESLSGAEEEILAGIARPWDLRDEEKADRDRRVAGRLLERFSSGAELAEYLDEVLRAVIDRQLADHPDPGHVLFHLFESSAAQAVEFWDWSVEHPDTPIASAAPLALGALRHAGVDVDDRLRLAATSSTIACRRIAATYMSNGTWFDDPTAAELELLESMARDDDPWVRDSIATALLRLRSRHPEIALTQALNARIEPGDRHGADTLFSTVEDYGVGRLATPDVDQLCTQLVAVSEPEYFAHRVLASLGEVNPSQVVDVWLRRLSRDEIGDEPGYRAIPFHDFGVEMLGSAVGEDRVALHLRVLGQLAPQGDLSVLELGRLYWRLALPGLPDDEQADNLIADRERQLDAALVAIERYLAGNDPETEGLGVMLCEMPWQALLASPAWVARLLDAGDEAVRTHLIGGLRTATIYGFHSRSPGNVSPRWAATLARAQSASITLSPGSHGAAFFEDLAALAQREIDDDRREDEAEGADWE